MTANTLKAPFTAQLLAPFITIEGGEGAGKSTLITALCQWMSARTIPHVATYEPGGTPIACALRAIFKLKSQEELTMEAEVLVISAARAQHVQHKILPALTHGQWVICDRFADSSQVYQSRLGGLPADYVQMVIDRTTFGLVPHLTLYLDCPPKIAQARIASDHRSSKDRYDHADQDFHHKLRQAYQDLARQEPKRIVTLDASVKQEAVLAAATAVICERFEL